MPIVLTLHQGRLFCLSLLRTQRRQHRRLSRCSPKHQRPPAAVRAAAERFHQLLRNLCQLLHLRFDVRFVFAFFETFPARSVQFRLQFVFRWQFIARFFNLFTGAVQQMVTTVTGLNQLFELTVGSALASASRTIFSISASFGPEDA